MAKKPEGDLGAMAISKAKAAETAPFTQRPAAASAAASVGSVKSLTVKLDGDIYAGLRAYCYERERATGTRMTHQQVMVEALKAFLPKAK
jgi:hypothetical protein